jgi:hypothetical protein
MVIRQAQPERFEAAAVRWIGRLAMERHRASLRDIREAAEAFERLGTNDEAALATLGKLVSP